MKKLYFLIASLVTLSLSAHEIELSVSLNPAGSFLAKSKNIKVEELKTSAGGFTAKNITLDLNTLETGIALRDKHMKEKYFETGKFKEAKLSEATGKAGKFTGKLNVHGVDHVINGTYEIAGKELSTKFVTKLTDFKIPEANYMSVGVEDEVEVKATFNMK